MAELTFEDRFAELRSLSQQIPDRAIFEAALGHLVSMAGLSWGRFEDEALPYAAAFMERWYAANPVCGVDLSSPFLVPRDRALGGLQQRARWLEVARELDLHKLGKLSLWHALTTRRQDHMRRVQVLHLRQSQIDTLTLRDALASPLFSQRLVALSLEQINLHNGLAPWADSPPAALRFLELGGSSTMNLDDKALARLAGLERLGMPRMIGGSYWPGPRQRLFEAARWPALRDLTWDARGADPISSAEVDAGLAAFGGQLERLELHRWSGDAATAARLLAGVGPLHTLLIHQNGGAGGARIALGEALGALPGLRELKLDQALPGAIEGGALLERLWLNMPSDEAIRALRDARSLTALRELAISLPAARLLAACDVLADADLLGGLRALTLRQLDDAAPLRALLRSGRLGELETLTLDVSADGAASVWAALLDAEQALGGLGEVTVSYPMWRTAQPLLAGTWLEGRLSYKLDMSW